MSAPQSSTYSQGHHTAVTANHVIRTAERDGAFILPHLKPHYRILDIGCGPGSITTGFAKYVPQGSVTGVDLTPDVIKQAQEFLKSQTSTTENRGDVSFEVGNVVEGLHFSDGTFDVVFCNQTLVHIPEPVKAMQEMKRVCKMGGFVACREGDFPFHFYPELPGLHLFQKSLWLLVHGGMPESSQTSKVIASDPQRPYNTPHPPGHRSGSRIHVWARLAGFAPERIVKDASVEVAATQERRNVFAGNMISRLEKAGHREKFLQLGATEDDVDTILRDLKLWKDDQDAWYSIMHCEVLCFV